MTDLAQLASIELFTYAEALAQAAFGRGSLQHSIAVPTVIGKACERPKVYDRHTGALIHDLNFSKL